MSLLNKITKTFRWLRWSTVLAILFYMFFIGLVLHSTTYKLQHTLRTRNHPHQQQEQQELLQHNNEQLPMVQHRLHERSQQQQEQHQQQQQWRQSSSSSGNNVLHAPPESGMESDTKTETSLGATLQNMRHGTIQKTKALLADSSVARSGSPAAAAAVAGAEARGRAVVADVESAASLYARTKTKLTQPETVILAGSSLNGKKILGNAFRRADVNHDGKLTIKELAVYINQKIVNHIEEAIQRNPREFRRVDIAPPDGVITWEEYHRFFLKEHGMSDADIDKHGEVKHTSLNRKAREDMMRDKARWSEAARTDLFSVTIDEYLSFRHPESSISNLLELVDDLLRQFDQDGDDQLSIEEFSEVNVDDDDDLMRKSLISKTVVERREEFKRILDKNNDGKADREELLNYVNPKTPRYALQESSTLFSLCDENKDGKLTLPEVLANAEIFLSSKMIDTANSFHTEF